MRTTRKARTARGTTAVALAALRRARPRGLRRRRQGRRRRRGGRDEGHGVRTDGPAAQAGRPEARGRRRLDAAPSRRTSPRFSRSSRSAPARTVTFVPAQDPIVNFLGTKIAGGSPPDVAMLPAGRCRRAGRGAEVGQAPRPRRPRRSSPRTTRKGWQDLGAVDGNQYGVYFKAANKSLVWYNTAAFENAGVAGAQDLEGLPEDGGDHLGVRRHAGLGRRRGRLDAHRLVRERVSLPGGPGEVRPARQARDQVDGPVRQAGADDARRAVGQARPDRGRRGRRAADGVPRRRSPRPSPAATSPRARWSSRATSSPSTSPRPRRRSARTRRCSRSRRSAPNRRW